MIKSKNEHGIHSPFLFQLYNNVLTSIDQYYCFSEIEKIRYRLLKDDTTFTEIGWGAGSKAIKKKQKKVSEVAKTSLATKEVAQRYFRLVTWLKPKNIIELGTSLGLTTAYLAKANTQTNVYTFEGNNFLNTAAAEVFKELKIVNVIQILGDISLTLKPFRK